MRLMNTPSEEKIRTTVDMPVAVHERVQQAVERGAAKSRNALIVQAVEKLLAELERDWIDAQFARMAEDETYQRLQMTMEHEFASADWEAWQTSESGNETR